MISSPWIRSRSSTVKTIEYRFTWGHHQDSLDRDFGGDLLAGGEWSFCRCPTKNSLYGDSGGVLLDGDHEEFLIESLGGGNRVSAPAVLKIKLVGQENQDFVKGIFDGDCSILYSHSFVIA